MKQGVVWSKDKGKLGKIDEVYEVNQTLMYGEIEEIEGMIKDKGLEKVKRIFLEKPSKIYTKPAVNFVAKYIFNLENGVNLDNYVKTIY